MTYQEKHAILVLVKDEKEQEEVYNRLLKEGYKIKAVSV